MAISEPVSVVTEMTENIDKAVLQLIESLGEKGLAPTIISSSTKVSYPEVEKIVGDAPAETVLEELFKKGDLVRVTAAKIAACPGCESSALPLRLICPRCESPNIIAKRLLQHVKCGYLGLDETHKGERGILCPKCHVEVSLRETDVRSMGKWFECAACSRKFDSPLALVYCDNCKKAFNVNEVNLKDCYAYKSIQAATPEVDKQYLTTLTMDTLRALNYQVEANVTIKGASGVPHHFDLMAFKPNSPEKTLIDIIATKTEANESMILAIYAKLLDVKGKNKPIVIINNELSEATRKLADHYKILAVGSSRPPLLMENLRKTIRE